MNGYNDGVFMTHEQLAKKFITKLYLGAFGYVGPSQEKEINDFMRHLKEAVKKDVPKPTFCRCDDYV